MLRTAARVLKHTWRYYLAPVPLNALLRLPGRSAWLWRRWRQYARLPGAEPTRFLQSYPQLWDAVSASGFDPHYFYQAVWAMERIAAGGAALHVDVGSDVRYVSQLTTHLPVLFVDIRPLRCDLPRLHGLAGSLQALPLAAQSVASLSCMHVVEHIGLGRYGDPLSVTGTRDACHELARVLAPGGSLFLSTPVGQPLVQYNAHRIHPPTQVIEWLADLTLTEFSVVDDGGRLRLHVRPQDYDQAGYACGLFWFQRG
jgi:hypothetical protein